MPKLRRNHGWVLLLAAVMAAPSVARADDLTDLVRAGQVEVQVAGRDIQSLSLRLRRAASAAPGRLPAEIAPGTYFAASDSADQNMVATAGKAVTLAGAEWVSLTLPAACADLHLRVPGAAAQFRIGKPPGGDDLPRAARALAAAHASAAVMQAGIWIMSDNAGLRGLGTLVRNGEEQLPGGQVVLHMNDRVISDDDAARALRILDAAGLGITSREVLGDRAEMLDEMRDEPLKAWLAALPTKVLPHVYTSLRDRALDRLQDGMRQQQSGKLDVAIDDYRAAIRSRGAASTQALVHQALANALQAKGDLAGAVGEYRAAIALAPSHGPAHRQLGAALQAQGDRAGAMAEYRRAIALQPDDAEAQRRLAAATAGGGTP